MVLHDFYYIALLVHNISSAYTYLWLQSCGYSVLHECKENMYTINLVLRMFTSKACVKPVDVLERAARSGTWVVVVITNDANSRL